MKHKRAAMLWLCWWLLCTVPYFAQTQDQTSTIKSIELKLMETLNWKYSVSGIDIDQALKSPTESEKLIKDPYHTLSGYFIFLAEGEPDWNLQSPKGFIGLYSLRKNSIIWRSAFLTEDFSKGPLGWVEETNEINNDGQVEIIILQIYLGDEDSERLWIFNWDGTEGKLITETTESGATTISVIAPYELVDVDGDKIFEIQGAQGAMDSIFADVLGSGPSAFYSWNGSLYGYWGKSSKYLLKEE